MSLSFPEPQFPVTASRILDAGLNRSAEALRVVEDICRFHWNLKGPARELKELRHAILGLFAPSPADRARWIDGRDLEGDLGRDLASPPAPPEPLPAGSELSAVAVRNLERAKEAFRAVEEVCRPWEPAKSRRVESLRYRLYSVEKGLLHFAQAGAAKMAQVRLYLLFTSSLLRGDLDEIVAAAIEGGVGAIQLREKESSDRRRLEIGRRLREITAQAGLPFIVNDRPDLALILEADGVHFGQDDLPVGAARRLVGERLAIGVSTHSLEQARQAAREGADYLGIGPVFPSTTKAAGPGLGPRGFQAIFQEIDLPAFAIGGIGPGNAGLLKSAGANRLAVSAAILQSASATEARAAAQSLRDALVD